MSVAIPPVLPIVPRERCNAFGIAWGEQDTTGPGLVAWRAGDGLRALLAGDGPLLPAQESPEASQPFVQLGLPKLSLLPEYERRSASSTSDTSGLACVITARPLAGGLKVEMLWRLTVLEFEPRAGLIPAVALFGLCGLLAKWSSPAASTLCSLTLLRILLDMLD